MSEEIRERIIAAADDLFYGRGFTQVSMDAVQDAAGVSLRSLYTQFPSKADLVIAVLTRRHETWTAGVTGRTRAVPDPRTRLLAVYDYLADWFEEAGFRGCGFINAFGELGAANPRVAEVVREHKRGFQRFVDQLVAEAGGPPPLGPQLAILAEGAQTTAAIAGAPDAAAHARAAAQTLIHVALAATGSSAPWPSATKAGVHAEAPPGPRRNTSETGE